MVFYRKNIKEKNPPNGVENQKVFYHFLQSFLQSMCQIFYIIKPLDKNKFVCYKIGGVNVYL